MFKKLSGAAIVIAIGLFALSSCGQQSGGQSSSVEGDGNASLQSSTIEFAWPDGYTYDPETNLLLAPSGPKKNYLPSYLVSINIKIVAKDGTVWYDINLTPSDYMSFYFQLDPGIYTFYAAAITTTSETYTAQQTLTLGPGSKVNLLFNFRLNAVPTISASAPGSVNKGGSVNISVTYSDLDDNETLTLTKSASGGTLGRSAGGDSSFLSAESYLTQASANFTWTAPDNKGTYTITFTVSDGHGGIATTTVTISVLNQAPTVTISADKSSVDVGDDILFTCSASDADSSDSGNLSLAFAGGPTNSGTGGTITETYTTQSSDAPSFTATCQATDSDGDSASASVTVAVADTQSVVISGSIAGGGCDLADEWDFSVVSGKSYTVTCSTSTSGGDLFLRRLYYSGSWTSDGTTNLTGANADETVTWTPSITGSYRLAIEDNNDNAIQYTCTFTGTLPTNMTQTGDDVGGGC